MNKLFLVGVGPGDPELITLKAIQAIEDSKVVFYIKNKTSNIALNIIRSYLSKNQILIPLKLSMSSDKRISKKEYKEIIRTISDYLIQYPCCFITLGDPAIYSSVFNIIDNFIKQVEVIPGVSSFSALSSNLKEPLILGNESLAVINLNSSIEVIKNTLLNNDSIIILRLVRDKIKLLINLLKELNLENNIVIYSNIGLDNSKISIDIKDLTEDIPYMTTVLIKKDMNTNSFTKI